jgi:hypothetical protein
MDPANTFLAHSESEVAKYRGTREMEDEDYLRSEHQMEMEEQTFEPASPATSTQTTDPTASIRRPREPEDSRAIQDETSSSLSNDDPLSPVGFSQTLDNKLGTMKKSQYSKKTTLPISPGQTCLAVDSEDEGANSKMDPPPERRKEPPLGNSTNRKSSATWTSTVSNKTFLGQLDRTNSSFDADSQQGSSFMKTSSGWIAKSRPHVRPQPSTSKEPGNIWYDSQDLGQGYKYHEVVRGKAKRQCLPGHDCPECKAFYECIHRNGHEFSQNPVEHTRHRAQYAPPETPENFWEMDFVDEKGGGRRTAAGG